jgi:hypothetical protein
MMRRTCALRAVTAGGLLLAIAQGNAKAGLQAWPLLLSPAQMALTPTMLMAGNPVPGMPSGLPGAPAPARQGRWSVGPITSSVPPSRGFR